MTVSRKAYILSCSWFDDFSLFPRFCRGAFPVWHSHVYFTIAPERVYNYITAMGFSAMFIFQLDNIRRKHCRNGRCRYVQALSSARTASCPCLVVQCRRLYWQSTIFARKRFQGKISVHTFLFEKMDMSWTSFQFLKTFFVLEFGDCMAMWATMWWCMGV